MGKHRTQPLTRNEIPTDATGKHVRAELLLSGERGMGTGPPQSRGDNDFPRDTEQLFQRTTVVLGRE